MVRYSISTRTWYMCAFLILCIFGAKEPDKPNKGGAHVKPKGVAQEQKLKVVGAEKKQEHTDIHTYTPRCAELAVAQGQPMHRIAVAFIGASRNVKYVLPSLQRHMFDVLDR
jgi:hypothetical protein